MRDGAGADERRGRRRRGRGGGGVMCCGIKEDEKKVLLDQQQMERMMSWGLYGYGIIVFTELGGSLFGGCRVAVVYVIRK